ncbi:MAG: Holliday junction resolvase RuvX [Candidatus Pacebacteria bacterium]|nr:Holliday junction resolvase RuvX [Candidatus Paceibacterota bacterium]
MRYLGIDFGTKRVGLALSDESGSMGFPHAVVPNDGRLIDYVRELIDRKEVETVIIGDSKDFSGNDNPVVAKAKAFATDLERTTSVNIVWEPEMLTTQEARRDPEGIRTNSREPVDASAAALILTSYLSHK